MHAEGVDLEQEDDAAGFLGVHTESNSKNEFLSMMQKGLIKRVLGTLGLDVGIANGSSPLPKESLLPNMLMESLPLAISITAVLL